MLALLRSLQRGRDSRSTWLNEKVAVEFCPVRRCSTFCWRRSLMGRFSARRAKGVSRRAPVLGAVGRQRVCAMGFTLVVGCGLIAFGPSMMLWLLLVGRRPVLVIIGIVSAFFWLASFTLASVLWTIVPEAQDVWMLAMTTGVGLQGFGRLALARVYMKTEKVVNEAYAASEADGFDGRNDQVGEGEGRSGGGREGGGGDGGSGAVSPDLRPGYLKLNRVSSSIVAGVGWGAMHAVIMVGTALSKNTGPGAAFSQSCPRVPSALVSAFSAQAFVLLDLLLMIVAFAAVQSGDAVLVSCSFGLHYLAALTTGFNFIEGGCAVSLPLLYGVVIVSAVSLGRFGPLKYAMRRLWR